MNSILQSIIAKIPNWTDAKELIIEEISGLTNQNYRVTVDRDRFVLRISGKNTEKLGINREHEFEVLRAVSDAGIGPKIVCFIKPEGHLVTQWIEGRHWTAEEYRKPENIRLMVETIKRLHALDSIEANFSPFSRVESFARTIQEFGIQLPQDFNGFLKTMHSIKVDQSRDLSGWLRFCHNDLAAVNYLYSDNEEKIIIIDWEFAGMGDVYFDLATLVYTHDTIGPISHELEEYLLNCYFEKVDDESRIRLAGMKFMLMLFSAMWGLLQHGMQKAGLVEEVEGFDYYDFAQYLFNNDVKARQADYLALKG
ncbi:MAG TPA: choline/ethanolamine kinase family protein [candidate division Zixibacteria bacterium]|nr:choline/ethanolamine kinase family protein [candidate division Zixibacteria bacterium]